MDFRLHNTRNKRDYNFPKPKTEKLKRTLSFAYSATHLWNSLTEDIKNCTSVTDFKTLYLKPEQQSDNNT